MHTLYSRVPQYMGLKFISYWCKSVSFLWSHYQLLSYKNSNHESKCGGQKGICLIILYDIAKTSEHYKPVSLFNYNCKSTNNLRVLKVGFLENISDLYISVNQRKKLVTSISHETNIIFDAAIHIFNL